MLCAPKFALLLQSAHTHAAAKPPHEGAITQDGNTRVKNRDPESLWYCREYWNGDSRDGLYSNGDGYHYFEMKGDGLVMKAFEYYETDDGEERATPLPELVGINWYDFFGFEDDELLETVPEHEFAYIESLHKK